MIPQIPTPLHRMRPGDYCRGGPEEYKTIPQMEKAVNKIKKEMEKQQGILILWKRPG